MVNCGGKKFLEHIFHEKSILKKLNIPKLKIVMLAFWGVDIINTRNQGNISILKNKYKT